MKVIGLIFIVALLPFFIFSQNEKAIWYFGNHAGLDFTTGSPIAITDGQLYTSEGCSSICDQNGDILFYTDGTDVYSKNHSLMENGTELMGYYSATQSSLVVPNPSNNGIFYIFTVDGIENYLVNGCRYSIVDINQNDGLGIITSKNIELFSPSCEKLASIRHVNGIDYWVIAHEWNTNSYYVYLVNSDGIGDPTIYNVGMYHDGNIRNAIGALKISPTGDKVVAAIEIDSKVEILDFNIQTGTLSNPIDISCPNNQRTYGVEISPNGNKLYISSWDPYESIYQFDLQAGNAVDIENSAIEIFSGGSIQRAALQLGPDHKIYVARRNQSYIGVISNPNEEGLLCNYEDLGVYLNGKTSLFGLPNYIQGSAQVFQTQDFTFEDQCTFDTTFFHITNTNTLDSLIWDFGDPGSGALNYSKEIDAFHIYYSSGSYDVVLVSYFATNTDTVYKNVNIEPSPQINLGNDTIVCTNSSFVLNAGPGYTSYNWQDGSTNETFEVESSGIYWVQVNNEYGCFGSDSIEIQLLPVPLIDLGNDTLICEGDELLLNAGGGYLSYLWNNGAADSTIIVDTTGIYFVEAINQFGCSAFDSILVEFYPVAIEELHIGSDTILCSGDDLFINAGAGYTFYQWQDGSTDSIFIADTAGVYWVYVENPCSYGSDTIIVDIYPELNINIGNDTSLCHSELLLLDPGFGYVSYLWQDGSFNQFFYAAQTGSYWVEVTDENSCSTIDTINITFVLPDVDIGSDTTVCSGDSVTFFASGQFSNYLWQNNSDGQSYTSGSQGVVWCEVMDSLGCIGRDSAFMDILFPPVISLGNDTSFCSGDTLWLFASPWNFENEIYWQDGSSDSAMLVSNQGAYWVTASNFCGMTKDTVFVFVKPLPLVFIGNDTILAMNTQIELNAGNEFEDYLWSDGSDKQTLTISEGGTYWVNVFDGQCYNSDSINIEPIECDLFIPIVFTPNRDGKNDYFFAVSSKDIIDFNLTVFNRWGEKIWETQDKDGKWNGQRGSANADDGTYFWVLQYKCIAAPIQYEKKGSVTLLR